MYFTYEDNKIFYKKFGSGKKTLVFLHGWGADHKCFLPYVYCFEQNYTCVVIDFPPFGKSKEPKNVWGVEEYAKMLKALVDFLNLDKLTLIAHSFGCRVAINFANCYTNLTSNLVLIGAAGCKPRRGLKYHLRVLKYKLSKNKSRPAGSTDYLNLSPHMRKCFVKIVNTYQEGEMKNIKLPTLLIFGENDKDTPLYMAKRMKRLIKKSKLNTIKNASHFCFVEKFDLVFDSICCFLKECDNGIF